MIPRETSIPLKRRLIYGYVHVRYAIEGISHKLGFGRGLQGASPHWVKRKIVRSYAKKFGARTLVETGTYMGDMLMAMASKFEMLYSIELSPAFHEKAKLRFQRKPHVLLLCGDSGAVLAEILPQLKGAAVFWLDAHYSGGSTARGTIDTPVAKELEQIFAHAEKRHVILIDDARDFTGRDGYPTLDELRNYVNHRRPDYEMQVAEDVIRITPRSARMSDGL